jgi:arginine/lysine/ornithine decarboxylase
LSITYAIPPFSGPTYAHSYEAFNLLSSTLKDVASGVLDTPEDENVREKDNPGIYSSQILSSSSFLSVTSTLTYLKENVKVDGSVIGRVSAETVISYPPGIPILVGKKT